MVRTVIKAVSWDGDLGAVVGLVRQAFAPDRLVRWAITGLEGRSLAVEAAVFVTGAAADGDDDAAADPLQSSRPLLDPGQGKPVAYSAAEDLAPAGASVVAQILPTGIGLDIGGYAGDGTPATNLLAAAADIVVTHPNAVNAAALNWAAPNVRYVEGHFLDEWLAGRVALRPVRTNRIGLVVDRRVAESGGMTLIDNAVNAFRRVGGGRIDPLMTAEPLELGLTEGPSGATHGSLANPGALLSAARNLAARGAEAIGIVADFSRLPLDLDAYAAGTGPDPIGGLEAILSRLVAQDLGLPCAHAPYLPPSWDPCDPRASAEELGAGYLMCILKGLHKAPRPGRPEAIKQSGSGRDDRRGSPAGTPPFDMASPSLPAAVIAPEGALGGPGVIAAAARGVPIIAVRNPSVLSVTADLLGIPAIPAASYLEAAGIVLALKAGLDPAMCGSAAPKAAISLIR